MISLSQMPCTPEHYADVEDHPTKELEHVEFEPIDITHRSGRAFVVPNPDQVERGDASEIAALKKVDRHE